MEQKKKFIIYSVFTFIVILGAIILVILLSNSEQENFHGVEIFQPSENQGIKILELGQNTVAPFYRLN